MEKAETLRIEIAYALPARQVLIALQVTAGTRVGEALACVDLSPDLSGLDLATMAVGIFGQRVSNDQVLRAGDRIEIYRALHADPKLARRARVERQRRGRFKER